MLPHFPIGLLCTSFHPLLETVDNDLGPKLYSRSQGTIADNHPLIAQTSSGSLNEVRLFRANAFYQLSY